jgi:hypothetical protein
MNWIDLGNKVYPETTFTPEQTAGSGHLPKETAMRGLACRLL